MIEQVTRNRASKAPGARSELYRQLVLKNSHQAMSERRMKRRKTLSGPLPTIMRLMRNLPVRTIMFVTPSRRVRSYDEVNDKFEIEWEGYPSPDEYTWEPPGHLHFNTMLQFFKTKKKRMPPHLRQYRAKI